MFTSYNQQFLHSSCKKMMANFLRETYYVLLALMATEEFAFFVLLDVSVCSAHNKH